jgi:hypothetical protein
VVNVASKNQYGLTFLAFKKTTYMTFLRAMSDFMNTMFEEERKGNQQLSNEGEHLNW